MVLFIIDWCKAIFWEYRSVFIMNMEKVTIIRSDFVRVICMVSWPLIIIELVLENGTLITNKLINIDAFLHHYWQVLTEQVACNIIVLVFADIFNHITNGFDLIIFQSIVNGRKVKIRRFVIFLWNLGAIDDWVFRVEEFFVIFTQEMFH